MVSPVEEEEDDDEDEEDESTPKDSGRSGFDDMGSVEEEDEEAEVERRLSSMEGWAPITRLSPPPPPSPPFALE